MGKVKANIVQLSKKNLTVSKTNITTDNGKTWKADDRRIKNSWNADNSARWNKIIEDAMKEQERRFPT